MKRDEQNIVNLRGRCIVPGRMSGKFPGFLVEFERPMSYAQIVNHLAEMETESSSPVLFVIKAMTDRVLPQHPSMEGENDEIESFE